MIPALAKMKIKLASLGERKSTLIWGAKYAAVLVVFLFFFLPFNSKLSVYSQKTEMLKNEIEDVKKLSVNLLTPVEMETIRVRLEDFESKLVDASRGSELLDKISDEAEKNHFQVIQIYSDNPILMKDDRGGDLEFDGKKLSLLPVSFRVETDYKNLAAFLRSLADNSKTLFVIEALQLQRSQTQADTLQCDITMSFIIK